MAKIGSSGNGKPSSLSVNNFGDGTVVGNIRDGSDKAHAPMMPQGKKPSTMQGSRSTFLGSGIASGSFAQVSAGTPGPGTGAGGKNETVTGSSASVPGRAAPTTLVDKVMKVGKKASTTAGTHKGYL